MHNNSKPMRLSLAALLALLVTLALGCEEKKPVLEVADPPVNKTIESDVVEEVPPGVQETQGPKE